MSRFAITDIHGCRESFRQLLEKINFQPSDELFLLGDYIDRGPDSKGVIDDIIQLQESGYSIVCLKGNHELGMLDSRTNLKLRRNWMISWGGLQTIESFDALDMDDVDPLYYEFMEGLGYFVVLHDYILVHAGLDFSKEKPLEDKQGMLWIRRWRDTVDRDWLDGKVIVHGHTPIGKEAIELQMNCLNEMPVIDIDGGCVYKCQEERGYLVALNLDTRELSFQECVDEVAFRT